MANVRGGVFTLRTLSRLKKDENWFALSDVWIAPSPFMATPPNTGYFGPISSPSGLRTDKVTFTSDTTAAVPGANLPGRYKLAATGSSAAGYFGGGDSPSPSKDSRMDKITYSTDSSSSVPGGSLSNGRSNLAATGNSTAGYFGGGQGAPTAPALAQSRMDKVTYSSETTAQVPGASLSTARLGLAAAGNLTAGYFGGGGNPGSLTTMDKVTYSTDTTAAVPGAALRAGRYAAAATGNSTAGYFGGGSTPSISNTMDKVTYSTDTTAAVPGANLSVARYLFAATGSSTAGYFGGGATPAQVTTMDKVTYSTDTTAAVPGAFLTGVPGASSHAASSALANALPSASFLNSAPAAPSVRYSDSLATPPNTGYFAGGSAPGPSGGNVRSMDKVNYSTDTSLSISGAVLSLAQFAYGATGSTTAGYFGGGRSASPGPTGPFSTMDKVTYSSDTTAAVPGAALSAARGYLAATGNSTAGYFGGGTPGPRSTMDKVTYSSDTRTTVPGASLSSARYYLAATGNQTAGYFGGGYLSIARTTMDKVTYSSDTTAAVPGASLSAAGQLNNATGNSTAGYFGGVGGSPGAGGKTTIDKITYSTDTRSTVPAAGSFLVARIAHGATGNSTAGYFGGGFLGPSDNVLSSVEKIDYATDTRALSFFLSNRDRAQLAATGARANGVTITEPPAATPTPVTSPALAPAPNTGYFGGGAPGPYSTMDKVTYSTDTTAAVPGAALSAGRYDMGATGSSTAGYFGGGNPGYRSTMDKVTYSTDITVAVPGTNLTVGRGNLAATGNSTHGYFGGGRLVIPAPPTFTAQMDKVTYSSDTTAAVPGANLSAARYVLAATGNSTNGYFGGGGSSPLATMDKVTYASDTTAAVPGAALSVARRFVAATGNSTAGYFGGGNGPHSTMDKVTYSTDTTAQVPGASLSSAKFYVAATGNSTAGYFGGGGFPTTAQMDKVTYSTDTTVAVPGANISVSRFSPAASSALANGLPTTITSTVPNIV